MAKTTDKTTASKKTTEMKKTAAPKTAAPKKAAAKKAVAKKEAAPAPVAASTEVVNEVVETPVVADPVADEVSSLSTQISELMGVLQKLSTESRAAATKLRAIDKQYQRTIKTCQKFSSKKRRACANRAPSGFVKPTLISQELASFLNKPFGSEMARTEVTKEINGYIRANKLQDAKNGRIIIPDTKLASLLKIGKNEELTYFNLQKYMSPHFAKMNKDSATTSV